MKNLGDNEGDYIYTEVNGNITIKGYMGSTKGLTVPSVLDEKPVTGMGAFSRNELTSITIPSGVTNIEYDALKREVGFFITLEILSSFSTHQIPPHSSRNFTYSLYIKCLYTYTIGAGLPNK